MPKHAAPLHTVLGYQYRELLHTVIITAVTLRLYVGGRRLWLIAMDGPHDDCGGRRRTVAVIGYGRIRGLPCRRLIIIVCFAR